MNSIRTAALSINISKQYRSLDQNNFQLQVDQQFPPGFTILFGPSGSGKSTILDCIAGLQTPDSGRIALGEHIFFDSATATVRPPQSRRIAYVFQSLALFPHLTVEQNVAYGLFATTSADHNDRVERVLRLFHITDLKRRKPRELSGGEKQRVALARSLATDPQLLLLDEPLTGLDAKLRAAILQDLREWNTTKRIPIIYVTHNREELEAIGERMVAIASGKVTGTGNPRQVLDAPQSLAMAQAAGFENVLSATVEELRPVDGTMHVILPPSSCELEIPLGVAQKGDAVRIAIRAGDILLATEHPRFLSARNVLPGTVESLETRGTLVMLKVNAGVPFLVHVTPGAVRSLGLRTGTLVWLVLKTHSCHVVFP
jgi:molybdate transport system ATP-binding protein